MRRESIQTLAERAGRSAALAAHALRAARRETALAEARVRLDHAITDLLRARAMITRALRKQAARGVPR